jgi:hypothetical protein
MIGTVAAKALFDLPAGTSTASLPPQASLLTRWDLAHYYTDSP